MYLFPESLIAGIEYSALGFTLGEFGGMPKDLRVGATSGYSIHSVL